MSSSQEAQGRWLWLWNRLRCMSFAEVLHRAGRSLSRRWRHSRMGESVPVPVLRAGARWIHLPPASALLQGSEPYVIEAQALLAGSLRLFEQQRFSVGAEPDWLRCPLTGVRAPLLPARRMRITDKAQVGDIKYLWELNRHLHWVTLAQAWALERDPVVLDLLRRQLQGWLAQNPAGLGPNGTSGLEAAIRLINWAVVWQLIGEADSPLFVGHEALRVQWLEAIYRHARQIARSYSRHSSANNHLIGELCGVYLAAHTWPFWVELEQSAAQARRELIEQLEAQVHPDGVPREQAFEYAAFIFDFLLLAERCAAAAGEAMPSAYGDRLAAMARFAQALLGGTGVAPAVGDADGAEALRLDPRPGRQALPALLEKQAALAGHAVPAWLQRRDDAAWLGLNSAGAGTLPAAPLDFPDGGYHLFACNSGTPQEVQGGLDAGPLGYLGIAAHGHADALQLWLTVGGLPLLVDPGTYAYWADKPWRDYFRGTAAHNTLQLMGRDQSESGGRFMWTRHAGARLLSLQREENGGLRLLATHNGYTPWTHERALRFDPQLLRLHVADRLNDPAPAALHWHLAPGWQCQLRDDVLHARQGPWRIQLRLTANAPGELSLVRAQTDPPLAWTSNAYGVKEPSSTLRWRGTAQQWRTEIEIRLASS
jgi:hypothetical protein